jgi:hypothetical protein
MKRFLLLPALLAAGAAEAQRPLATGTAAALGGAGVTEARRADALLHNPALLGLWDGGPAASQSFLSLDLARLPGEGSFDGSVRLGLIGGGVERRTRLLQYSGPLADGSSYPGAVGGVTWGAFQNRDFALSLSTHFSAFADIPPAIRRSLGAGEAASPATGESGRTASTVLAVGRAFPLGTLPGVGPVWAGATAKGWNVHTHARGAFAATEPGTDVYRETVFRNVPGYGVDLGVSASPGRLRLGASVANALTGSLRPATGPRERTLSVAGADDGGRAVVSEVVGPEIDFGDLGTEPFEGASRAWRDAHFPATLRAGAAYDAGFGTVALAARHVLRRGGLEPATGDERFTAAFRGPATLPLRASYGWGDGVRGFGLGVDAGSCARRWTVGVERRDGRDGTSVGVSASLRLMDPSCAAAR